MRVRATIVAVEKQLSITYSECVFVALGIHYAIRMRHLWPARFYNIFPHNLINWRILKKKTESKLRFFIFSANFVWNIFNSKKN